MVKRGVPHYKTPTDMLFTQSNVTALIDMKLEKHKNLNEESSFYWREIKSGTFKFNRKDEEVIDISCS